MGRTPTAEVVAVVRGAAERVMAEVGFEGVTIRAVATEAGVSPQVIYTRFGTQQAVLDDVATAGFRRLGHRLLGPVDRPFDSIDDPLSVVIGTFRRYREFATAEPELHRFLFDGLDHVMTPSMRTERIRRETLGVFVSATRMAVDAGLLLPGSPNDIANRLWAAAHGAVRLERSRVTLTDDAAGGFEATLATMIRGLRPSAQLR